MEMLRKNKVFLIDTLSTDSIIVLQHVQNDNIITKRDYNNLNQPKDTGEKIIINLLDNVMGKGEETCQKLLKMLEKKELQEIFPQLKELSITQQTPQQTSEERTNGPVMTPAAEQSKGFEFVDKHRGALIQRVTSVMEIADGLLSKQMITNEVYNTIQAAATSQEKMRIMYWSFNSRAVKGEFYRILKQKQPYLVQDLEQEM
ncbi:apoptosis-associated speck-like protein containing a CARD [Silurus meridionalis]|uniref:CARD domain-containing protein n=1 Tax=Silurus meridionalis TaxID=175797 RepID=A0A8T0B3W0_SILME|nr:apoptosis-associated speck-like protein containing a CARD [Silurus meridionalis]XP_046719506.1 apoptosis-associated speck-like protein containing a CARD [Silurus meridionalis]KAF7700468.1 hypothetical protein HF521_003426 [Silurus meridionalis]